VVTVTLQGKLNTKLKQRCVENALGKHQIEAGPPLTFAYVVGAPKPVEADGAPATTPAPGATPAATPGAGGAPAAPPPAPAPSASASAPPASAPPAGPPPSPLPPAGPSGAAGSGSY
jgi:hypothetical protein